MKGNNRKLTEKDKRGIVQCQLEGKHRPARFIRDRLGMLVQEDTVWRVLVKHHLNRISLPPVKPIWRFEARHPNELWQIDIMGEVTSPLVGDLPLIAAIDNHNRFIPSGRVFYRKFGINVFMVMYEAFNRFGLPEGRSYLLRTNWTERDPHRICKTYIELTQVEDPFRITKSDLGIRPIYHQRSDRTQSHILVCFLALAMWRALQQWISNCGIETAPRKLLEELREIRSFDVLLPSKDKTIRLRGVAIAPQGLKVLLHHLKLPLPNRPKLIQNVVAHFDP